MSEVQQTTQEASQTLPPENTAEVSEPIEKSSGDSMTSFDELEAVDNFQSKEVEKEAEKKAEIEEKAEQIKQAKGDTDAEAKTETEAETEATSEGDEVLEEDIKTFKFKNGEDESELRSDSLHTVKIDGKEEDVSYQELVNSYAGQQAVKRRFDEFSKERQGYLKERDKFVRDREELIATVNDITGMLQKNPIQGMTMIAEMSGLDGQQFQKQFMEKMVPAIESYMDMTDEERRARDESMRTEQESLKLERERTKFEREQNRSRLAQQISQLKMKHGINDDEFRETFVELEELQKSGHLEGEITPDLIAKTVVEDRLESKVKGVLEVVRPSLAEDEGALDDLIDVLQDVDPEGEFSDDDIKNIVQQSFPSDQVEAAEKKLSKKVKSSKSVKNNVGTRDPGREIVSFDELDF